MKTVQYYSISSVVTCSLSSFVMFRSHNTTTVMKYMQISFMVSR